LNSIQAVWRIKAPFRIPNAVCWVNQLPEAGMLSNWGHYQLSCSSKQDSHVAKTQVLLVDWCRVMQQQILDKNGFEGEKAWAFGLGLERLAMVLFSIPDIRLFWTSDQRFTKQFKAGNLAAKFKPYSKYPPCFKVGQSSLQCTCFLQQTTLPLVNVLEYASICIQNIKSSLVQA